MVKFYLMKINDRTITVDDVPPKWCDEVAKELEQQESE